MISNRRQILPFFVVLVMVVSVFAFIPAKAEASLTATLEGRNGNYSFASVNGSADYTVTIVNDGDFDFTEVDISAAFADPTWLPKNVTFTNSTETTNATMLNDTIFASKSQPAYAITQEIILHHPPSSINDWQL